MNEIDLLNKFANIKTWRKFGERAPHKPLLILYALAQFQQKSSSAMAFTAVKDQLKDLLQDFGPYRKTYHPEQPFVRLANDDSLWFLEGSQSINSKNFTKKELQDYNIIGAFKPEVENLLRNKPELIHTISQQLLYENFPYSIHQDILDAIGLKPLSDLKILLNPKTRDPKFRERLLIAYEYKCAICNYDIRLGNTSIGLEAAHIMWKNVNGPDIEQNGILLCSIHHKLFDRGAFTISRNHNVIVSDKANGNFGLKEWLLNYHNSQIRFPQRKEYYPYKEFTDWHLKEVFHGYSRA